MAEHSNDFTTPELVARVDDESDSADSTSAVVSMTPSPSKVVRTARSGPGAGLGLALAKRIFEGVGGRISAETKAEGGALFSVLLPVG